MKAILFLFLLCALGAQHNSNNELVRGRIRILCTEYEGQFAVSVMVPKGIAADHAIVEIGYRTHVPGIKEELFLTKVSVIPAVPEAWVGSDPVPAGRDKVTRVDVTLVKDVERERFEITREAK
jgi:hypothetical protein